jgi:O-antigen/teichoic acid export membrane protein
LVGALLPLGLSLVTVPLYLRLVGIERYGVLQISWLLLGYFGLFDLGLGRATAFRIAALRNAPASARAETFWSALAVNIAMGCIGGVVLWIVGRYALVDHAHVSAALQAELAASVPLLALGVPIATVTGVLTGALQGRERFLETNSISVTSTALFQVLPLAIAFTLGPRLPMLLLAALCARGLALVPLALRCHIDLTRHQPIAVRVDRMRDLLSYGGWVTLSAVFGPMLVIADRFAMGATLGMAAVAIYSIPYNMASRIAVLPSALTNALFPRLSAAVPDEARAIGEQALRVLMGLISPPVLIAVLAADPLLRLWVGAKMGIAAAPIARVLIYAFWFNALALVAFTRLQARGRPDLVAKILIAQIPPYWLGLYFAVSHQSLLGCAVVFLLRLVADYGLQSWFSDQHFTAWGQLMRNAVLLGAAVLVSQFLRITDPLWWACAVALVLAMVVFNIRELWPLWQGRLRSRRRRAVGAAA